MSGEVKYNIRGIEDLLKGLYNTYYFVFMIEDKDVIEAWIKAGITNAVGEYINDDWRNYFEEVSVEEFSEETRVLGNILLLPLMATGKPLRKGLIIGKDPLSLLMFSDVNVEGFIIENNGVYEMHYLLFNGFEIMTQEVKKLFIRTRAQSNGGMLYRITSD